MKAQERYLDSLSLLPKEDLKKFLPDALLEDLEGCTTVEQLHKVFNASLLFLDVSGFSLVTNYLQSETNEGSDLLTTHLNAYFKIIIEVVKAHGGDIVLFSGDALLVMWREEDATHACQQAVLCGVALQRDASEYTFNVKSKAGEEVPLGMSLHIGGAYGEVMSTRVGGVVPTCEGCWKYVVVGLPIEVVGVACNLGTAGDFCISELMRVHADPLCTETTPVQGTVDEAVQDFFFVNAVDASSDLKVQGRETAVDAAVASLFTFDTLIHSAVHKSQGQLRTVSSVFIKLRGLTIDTNYAEMHKRLHNSVCIVQKALTRLGGILNKVIMDDKGVILVCLFGIPFHSHEDDAERSCLFALKVTKRLYKEVGETAVGVSKATVFCGLSGCDLRYEYTVLGDGVNLAARLMTKCEAFTKKRHVICDGLTAAAVSGSMKVRNAVAFLPAGELALKGQAKSIASFHVVNAGDADSFAKRIAESAGSVSNSRHSYTSSASSFGSLFSRGSLASAHSRHSAPSKAPLGSPKIASRVPRHIRSNMSVTSSLSERGFSASESNSRFMSEAEFKLTRCDTLICRKKELAKLIQFCDAAAKGRGKLVCCIKGGAQTGKTAFLQQAEEHLTEQNATSYLLVGSDTQNHPFESLKLATYRLIDPDIIDLASVVDTADLAWLSYIVRDPKLTAPTEEQAKLSPVDKLDQICTVLLQLMQHSERPVVLLVDNIANVDRETQYFILRAKEEGIHTILTHNTERGMHVAVGDFVDRKTASTASEEGVLPFEVEMGSTHSHDVARLMKSDTTIVLRPFTEQQHYQLLTFLFNSDVGSRLREEMFSKTGGVPGYASQIASQLMELGGVRYEYGQTALVENYDLNENAVRFVNGFEARVMKVVDSLPQKVKDCLHVCSTLGYSFEKSFLEKVSGLSDLGSSLDCLDASEVLAADGDYLLFTAHLIKDAVYASMVKEDRVGAHRRITEAASHISTFPPEALFKHLTITNSEVPLALCLRAATEALECCRLEESIKYLRHLGTYTLDPKDEMFYLFNTMAVHSELGHGAEALSNLDRTLEMLDIKPVQRGRRFFCCGGEVVPMEEDSLVAAVLWMAVEVAFLKGKKAPLVKAWKRYLGSVPPSPEVASREAVIKFLTGEAQALSRTMVNKACPVAAGLVFGLKSVMPSSKFDICSQSCSLLQDLPFEDTVIRGVWGGGRPSAVGMNKAMQVINLIFKGDHSHADEVIEEIRALPSPRWATIGLLMKTVLGRYYHLDPPLQDRKHEVASVWASESEIQSPRDMSHDVLLSPLVACTQFRHSEGMAAVAELNSTDFLTPMHAFAAVVVLDRHLGVNDTTSSQVREVWEVLRQATVKYSIFDVAVKFFDGVTMLHGGRNDEADDLFRAVVELAASKGIPECLWSWRANARLLSSPLKALDSRFTPADIQAMKEHVAVAIGRKLCASEITSLQFIIDNARDKP